MYIATHLYFFEQPESRRPDPLLQDSTSKLASKVGATKSSYNSFPKPLDFANPVNEVPPWETILTMCDHGALLIVMPWAALASSGSADLN